MAALSAEAFGFDISEPVAAERWRGRLLHGLQTDPQGGFVAELNGTLTGFAQALLREQLWCLSLLVVSPSQQNGGVGRRLLDCAISYGPADAPGLIPSSNDERALRLYADAGFTLLPTVQAGGTIDARTFLPPDPEIRECGSEELDDLAGISREIRGAPHTAEIRFALAAGARLLRLGDRGFAVAMPGFSVWLLVARDEGAASRLLWAALARVGESDRPWARWITEEQTWALDVLSRAGLEVVPYGALCVRGNPGPLRPFLPSGPFS